MTIKIGRQQDELLMEWYRGSVREHHKAECGPPGFTLEIEMGQQLPYEATAVAICRNSRLDLGEVS